MSTLAVAFVIVALALAADLSGRRLPGRWRRGPMLALCLGLALVALELTRYDHGFGREYAGIAFLAAPVVVIFGGALAGARRWYGYPDLGPWPGRAAGIASSILLGVLLGMSVRDADVEATVKRGNALAAELALARQQDGRWPELPRSGHLGRAIEWPVETRMGTIAPPPFAFDAATGLLSFPVSSKASLALDVSKSEKPKWTKVDR